MSAPPINWPTVGSTWVDDTGRTLRVDAVQPNSKQERHIVGVLLEVSRERAYACDLRTFDVVWRPGAVTPTAEGSDAAEAKVGATALYRDGKALPYTRRQ